MIDDSVQLTAGEYSARLGRQGAALHSCRHLGRELIYRIDDPVAAPPFAGAILAPWPNRVAGGRYRFAGDQHQLPLNEVDLGNALHGLALWEKWQVISATADSATLEHTIWPRPGYPFEITVHATYELGLDGLRLTVNATNTGDVAAPVGLSAHPYLTVGDDSLLDRWAMKIPCDEVIVTDDQLLPTGTRGVSAEGLDFRHAVPIGAREMDNAFTGVAFHHGVASAELVNEAGEGVRMSWDTSCRYLQVYTLHRPGHAMHRRALAIEPMTCAPDAFNSGSGLIVLEPGGATSMRLSITAVTPGQSTTIASASCMSHHLGSVDS